MRDVIKNDSLVEVDTGEILADLGLPPDYSVKTIEDMLKGFERMRLKEDHADIVSVQLNNYTKTERAEINRLKASATWWFETNKDKITELVKEAFESNKIKRIPGMTAKQWVTKYITICLKDKPESFEVTDYKLLLDYCKSYAPELLNATIELEKDALQDVFGSLNEYNSEKGVSLSVDEESVLHLLTEGKRLKLVLTVNADAFIKRLKAFPYPEDAEHDEPCFVMDMITAEHVTTFVKYTPKIEKHEMTLKRSAITEE